MSLSTSLNSLHQLSSAIKSLQVPSPVHEEIKCSKKDVLSPTKLNQVSVEDFVEKVVGRILKEVEKVWIQLQYLENTAEVSLKTRYNDVIFVKENNWVVIAILTLMSSIDKNVPTRRAFVLKQKIPLFDSLQIWITKTVLSPVHVSFIQNNVVS